MSLLINPYKVLTIIKIKLKYMSYICNELFFSLYTINISYFLIRKLDFIVKNIYNRKTIIHFNGKFRFPIIYIYFIFNDFKVKNVYIFLTI